MTARSSSPDSDIPARPCRAQEIHELDARPILAAGRSPLAAVIEAVSSLPPLGSLRLIMPFEPVPMMEKLTELGFEHTMRRRGDRAVEVLFSRKAPPPEPTVLDLRNEHTADVAARVLSVIQALAPGQLLIMRTQENPEPLFPRLAGAGACWEAESLPDGTWQTCIAPPRIP